MPCEQEGCEAKKVNYGYYADKIKLRCFDHKIVGMIDLSRNLCKECPTRATYGIPGGKPEYCKPHSCNKTGVENLTSKRCEHPGCPLTPSFNIPDIKSGKYCGDHKLTGMVNVLAKGCEYPGCPITNPCFNIRGMTAGKFCNTHKSLEMVDVKHAICMNPVCTTRASYNYEGQTKPLYCALDALSGMINVTCNKCAEPGCPVDYPAFNMPGITPGIYCFKHKATGMIDVKSKGCEHPGCPITNPCFNIRGMLSGRFCKQHKVEGMVDVTHKPCENLACDKRASYGVAGTKTVRYCYDHKDPGMVDLFGSKCINPGCPKSPTFNLPNMKPKYCGDHKTDDMVDLVSNLCRLCPKNACFNTPGEKRPLYCKTCATSTMVDVKHNMCQDPGCTGSVRASYGLPGKTPTHCATHRKTGMLNSPNAKCQNCKEQAIYGGTALKPVRCETHKALDDLNLVERPCSSCGLLYVLDANNRCETCDPTNFQRAHLAKQKALMDYLDTHGHPGTQTDIMIDGGACGRERPDRLFDYGDKIVIVECDENQHKDRSPECERTRMFNIGQALGGIPVYFIRWNPDGYKTGIAGRHGEAITKRYEYLVNMLAGIRGGTVILPVVGQQELVKCCYLFFDKFKKEDSVSWMPIAG
jgi:hypothetical protein